MRDACQPFRLTDGKAAIVKGADEVYLSFLGCDGLNGSRRGMVFYKWDGTEEESASAQPLRFDGNRYSAAQRLT